MLYSQILRIVHSESEPEGAQKQFADLERQEREDSDAEARIPKMELAKRTRDREI